MIDALGFGPDDDENQQDEGGNKRKRNYYTLELVTATEDLASPIDTPPTEAITDAAPVAPEPPVLVDAIQPELVPETEMGEADREFFED